MPKLPGLVGFIVRSWAIGGAIGAGFAALLIYTDTASLWTLMQASASPYAATGLLLGGFATLFGSLYAGSAIMMLPRDKDDGFGNSGDGA